MNEATQPVSGGGRLVSATAMVAALVAFLVFAPFASAANDPVAGGKTSIVLKKGFIKTLKRQGVKLLKVKPATLKGRTVGFPIKEGTVDPTTGAANLTHEGGMTFKRGKKKAKVTALVIETSTASLKAKVAGKNMKFASVVGYSVARDGFGVNFSATKLKLTNKAAKQLNKKLGFTGKKKGKSSATASAKRKAPFKANQAVGNATGEVEPKTVTVLPGGVASLTTDKATVEKFEDGPIPDEGLGVTIEGAAPGERDDSVFPPILKFPIGGGTIAPNGSSGIVQTLGGAKLVQSPGEECALFIGEVCAATFGEASGGAIKGTTTMTLGAIWVDLSAKTATVEVLIESSVSDKLNLGNLGRSSIADVNLTGATIVSDPATRTISIQNATATLQPVTAETLNDVFGSVWDSAKVPHKTFAAGDGLGTFSFSVQTQ